MPRIPEESPAPETPLERIVRERIDRIAASPVEGYVDKDLSMAIVDEELENCMR